MRIKLNNFQAIANGYEYSENTEIGAILYPKEKTNTEKELDQLASKDK